MTLRTIFPGSFRGNYRGAIVDGQTPKFDLPTLPDIILENGVSSGEADLVYDALLSVPLSGSQTLTLGNASLKDPLGVALTFVKVKALWVTVDKLAPSKLIVGNAAANPFLGPLLGTTPTHDVQPGGVWGYVAPQTGFTVGAGTADQIKFANGGAIGPVNFRVLIAGTSA